MAKNKKGTKKGNKIYKFWGILLLIASLIFTGLIVYVDILPLKYLLALVGGLFLLNIICDFFLFRKKVKKKPKKIFSVISIIFTLILLGGSFFIYKTFGVLTDMSKEYKWYTYHVVVKNDSSYQNIKDIEGKTLGYYNDNSDQIKKAIPTLKKKVTTENEGYGNLESLGSDVLTSEKDAILLENSQKTKLEKSNSESLMGFTAGTRVIYTFKVKVKVKDGVDVTRDTFNVYISGMDEYGKVAEVSRSDVNILMTINPKTKQILITNIPRDYYVQLHDTTGNKDKLTHAGTYGLETSVNTIEDLMGIKIDYYVKVNFSSLENIVDAIGGVEAYSEYDFRSWNGYNFSKGYNNITDGKMALAFARERHAFNDGDNQRGKNQQALIEAIFRKCTSAGIITKYNGLLNSLKDAMLTNMSTKNMSKLAKMQLKDNAKWVITSQSVTGTGSSDYTYTYPGQLLYVMVPDDESVAKAKEEINKVENGELLESSYNETNTGSKTVTKSAVYRQAPSNTTTKAKKKVVTKKKVATKQAVVKKPVEKKETPVVPEKKEEQQEPIVPEEEKQEPVVPEEQNQETE